MLSDNIRYDESGDLLFAGVRTKDLADKYGTPLYLMDEDRIRANCRMYLSAMGAAFDGNWEILYACKAACYKALIQTVAEEGLSLDVVSSGEILTAVRAGFPMDRVYFHSNNKTEKDLVFALEQGVGTVVVDQLSELALLSRIAEARSEDQDILLRLTPGIDTHTYEAINTGKVDSKFGFAIETGQAVDAIELALSLPGIRLKGYHCHVGSQVFGEDVFERSAEVMLRFTDEIGQRTGYYPEILDLGGGYGVRYTEDDPEVSIPDKIASLARTVRAVCAELSMDVPRILLEPGRSIVADAGMTLYTVGNVKRIPGYKNYVSVDGGMTDNPRYALYGAKYTVLPAVLSMKSRFDADLVGRCCESGDIIQPNVSLPEEMKPGDLVAVCTTGAYHYSMASNYNRIPRPPVVFLHDGQDRLAVRGETLEDLLQYDL